MKRKFFAVFAVLLAVMLATCDLAEQPSATKYDLPQYTPDGQPLVQLTINIGNSIGKKSASRALTLQQAKDNVDGADGFYEVAFLDAKDRIYRYSIPADEIDDGWVIAVPVGTYGSADKAVMLAGAVIDSEYVLLAIGHITGVNDKEGNPSASAPGVINKSTGSVIFMLNALESKVGDLADPAFKILGPTEHDNGDYSWDGIMEDETDDTIAKFIVPAKGTFNSGHDATTATVEDDIIGQYTVTCTDDISNFKGLAVANHDSYPTAQYNSSNVTAVVTPISPAIGAPLTDGSTDAIFQFYIDVNGSTATTGLTKMYIAVPVHAINNAQGIDLIEDDDDVSPIDWIIQSGIDKAAFDEIDGTDSEGALFLLELSDEIMTTELTIPKGEL